MRTILVTGAAGFIGYHLAERLLGRGDAVIGVDNMSAYYDVGLKRARIEQLRRHERFSFIQLDLSDRPATDELFRSYSFSAIAHMAAQPGVRYSLANPHAYTESNLTGFLNVLEGARHHGTEHLVYASSSSVYGANTRMPLSVTHNVDHPISLYAATKKANELMAHTYSHLFGIATTGLRFFTVYGPWGRPDMAYFEFTRALFAGEPIDLYNHGKMLRDFTYIDDIIDGVERVLDRPAVPDPDWRADSPSPASSSAPYRLYNIGNNTPVELMRFLAVLEKAVGRSADIRYRDLQPGDVVATFADVAELEREFGFKPRTDVEQGLNEFVRWYRSFYEAPAA